MKLIANRKQRTILLTIAVFVTMTATLATCSPLDWFGKRELHGTVMDEETKQPIEGAYVMAIYIEVDSGIAAKAIYCVKTKGMMTGKDGTFVFPIEKSDGHSPNQVTAIKPGYFLKLSAFSHYTMWNWGNESGRDISLQKQNPEKPEFWGISNACERPKSHADVVANIEYFNILLPEYIKYGVKKESIEAVREIIQMLEKKPTAMPKSSK